MSSTVRLIPLLSALALLAACGSSSTTGSSGPPVTLHVFAAASLTDAFNQIGNDYHKIHPNVTLSFNYAGSQQLAEQITMGAPADVFASANATQMQVIVTGGEIAASSPQTFVKNRLVVITPKSNPANIQTLQDLAKPGIKLDLADKTVPVGQYSLTFLMKASADPSFGASYQANVLKNVVSYETDDETVFTKVHLGEADAGIVYTSDVSTNGSEVGSISIPDAYNTIASYPIAPITNSANATQAAQFIAYVLSTAGQATLGKFGFITVNAAG